MLWVIASRGEQYQSIWYLCISQTVLFKASNTRFNAFLSVLTFPLNWTRDLLKPCYTVWASGCLCHQLTPSLHICICKYRVFKHDKNETSTAQVSSKSQILHVDLLTPGYRRFFEVSEWCSTDYMVRSMRVGFPKDVVWEKMFLWTYKTLRMCVCERLISSISNNELLSSGIQMAFHYLGTLQWGLERGAD